MLFNLKKNVRCFWLRLCSPLKFYSYLKMVKKITQYSQYSPKHPTFSYPTQPYAMLITILC